MSASKGGRRPTASQRRQHRQRRQSKEQGRGARRLAREEPTEIDLLLADPDGLANADPLMAELVAASAFANWQDIAGPDETEAGFLSAVLESFAQEATRNSLSILLAMAPMLYPRDVKQGRAAIQRIRSGGVADPPWASTIGRPAFRGAKSAAADEFGDIVLVAATFQHAGRPPHTFYLAHDTNARNLIVEAHLIEDATDRPDALAEHAVGPVRTLEPRELANLLFEGSFHSLAPEFYPKASVDPGVPRLVPILRARRNVLPEPRLSRSRQLTIPGRRALVAEFLAAAWPTEPASMRIRSPRFRTARDVGAVLVDCGVDSATGDPLRCTPWTLEEALLEDLPIELGPELDPDEVLDALERWIHFTGWRTNRPEPLTSRLIALLDELVPTFRRLIAVERRAAEKLAAAMHRDGVDVSKRTEVADWLERFEALPIAKRNRLLGHLE